MAGAAVRTTSVYRALRSLAGNSRRCVERADAWKREYGEDDELRRAELVRAEAYMEAVRFLVEQLDLDSGELWPDCDVSN